MNSLTPGAFDRLLLRSGFCNLIALSTLFVNLNSMNYALAQTITAEAKSGIQTSTLTNGEIQLSVLGQYQGGIYNQSGAEIVGYDSASQQAFVINAYSGQVDVLSLSDPASPTKLFTIDVSDLGGHANSVSVKNGVVAIAVEGKTITDDGFLAVYDVSGNRQAVVGVGALPDAVTFSPDGRYILVANEGEPNKDYTVDPEGSVSIIEVPSDISQLTQDHVRTADFRSFNGREDELRKQGVRIFGPGASAAQDFEPEWIEVSADSSTAYVALQENNAIAVIDIPTATVTNIFPLGYKDWSAEGQWAGSGFDASDRDSGINIRHWPVYGMFQPDTIRLYETNGKTYLLTANEGDSRDYKGWSEEVRVGKLKLDPTAFPNAEELQKDENLGRLLVTKTMGVSNGCNPSDPYVNVERDCVYDSLYAYGARSMSIWRVHSDRLELVFDTGSQLEETIATKYPNYFNADHQQRPKQLDARSASKGPEPEGMAVGEVDGRTYAFLGLERIGGVMVYDITEPTSTRFVQYINNRDFSISEDENADQTVTDLGAEGLHFVASHESPDPQGRPLLLVGNEVSGTTTVFVIESTQATIAKE